MSNIKLKRELSRLFKAGDDPKTYMDKLQYIYKDAYKDLITGLITTYKKEVYKNIYNEYILPSLNKFNKFVEASVMEVFEISAKGSDVTVSSEIKDELKFVDIDGNKSHERISNPYIGDIAPIVDIIQQPFGKSIVEEVSVNTTVELPKHDIPYMIIIPSYAHCYDVNVIFKDPIQPLVNRATLEIDFCALVVDIIYLYDNELVIDGNITETGEVVVDKLVDKYVNFTIALIVANMRKTYRHYKTFIYYMYEEITKIYPELVYIQRFLGEAIYDIFAAPVGKSILQFYMSAHCTSTIDLLSDMQMDDLLNSESTFGTAGTRYLGGLTGLLAYSFEDVQREYKISMNKYHDLVEAICIDIFSMITAYASDKHMIGDSLKEVITHRLSQITLTYKNHFDKLDNTGQIMVSDIYAYPNTLMPTDIKAISMGLMSKLRKANYNHTQSKVLAPKMSTTFESTSILNDLDYINTVVLEDGDVLKEIKLKGHSTAAINLFNTQLRKNLEFEDALKLTLNAQLCRSLARCKEASVEGRTFISDIDVIIAKANQRLKEKIV